MTNKNNNAYFIAGGHGMLSLFDYIFSTRELNHHIYFGVVDSGGSTGDILKLFNEKNILPMGDMRNTLANMATFQSKNHNLLPEQVKRLDSIAELLNSRTKDPEELQHKLAELQLCLYGTLDSCVADFSAEFLSRRNSEDMEGSMNVGNILIAAFMYEGRVEELIGRLDFVPENIELKFVNNERLVQVGIDLEGNKYIGEASIDNAKLPIPPLWYWTQNINGERVESISEEVKKEISEMDNLIIPAGSVANTFDGLPKLGTEILSNINIIRVGNFAVGPNEVHPIIEIKMLFDAGIQNIKYLFPKGIKKENHPKHFDRYAGEGKEILEWPEDEDKLREYLVDNLQKYHLAADSFDREEAYNSVDEILSLGIIEFSEGLIDFVEGNGVHHNPEKLGEGVHQSTIEEIYDRPSVA